MFSGDLKKQSLYLGRLAGGLRKQTRALEKTLEKDELRTLIDAARILEVVQGDISHQARTEESEEEASRRAWYQRYIARGKEFLRGLTGVEAIARASALGDYVNQVEPHSGFGPFRDLSWLVRAINEGCAPNWQQRLSLAVGQVLEEIERPGKRGATLQDFMAFEPEWRASRDREAVIAASPNVVRLKA